MVGAGRAARVACTFQDGHFRALVAIERRGKRDRRPAHAAARPGGDLVAQGADEVVDLRRADPVELIVVACWARQVADGRRRAENLDEPRVAAGRARASGWRYGARKGWFLRDSNGSLHPNTCSRLCFSYLLLLLTTFSYLFCFTPPLKKSWRQAQEPRALHELDAAPARGLDAYPRAGAADMLRWARTLGVRVFQVQVFTAGAQTSARDTPSPDTT